MPPPKAARRRPAAVREGRVRRLPRVRHPGPRLPEATLRRLRARQAGCLQRQAARLLPVVRCPAFGTGSGPPGQPRHPPRAGSAMGAVVADSAAAHRARAYRTGDARGRTAFRTLRRVAAGLENPPVPGHLACVAKLSVPHEFNPDRGNSDSRRDGARQRNHRWPSRGKQECMRQPTS